MGEIVQFTKVTDGTADGDGYFDKLMVSLGNHLDLAVNANRITQGEAGQVYSNVIPSMIQESTKFALQEDLTNAQLKAEEQDLKLDLIKADLESKKLEIAGKDLLIKDQQIEIEKVNLDLKDRELDLKDRELDIAEEQLDKLKEEILIIIAQRNQIAVDSARADENQKLGILPSMLGK
jgi:hypothetical protein